MRDGWIIYAIVGVIVCLLLWRVATQWKVRSAEAENLRASLIILGVLRLLLSFGTACSSKGAFDYSTFAFSSRAKRNALKRCMFLTAAS
jgi:hypothetical protein